MQSTYSLQNVLFLDIETVPVVYEYSQLTDDARALWDAKFRFLRTEGNTAEVDYSKAGIYAEFAKIVCISTGYIFHQNNTKKFKLKSFYWADEKKLLLDFCKYLQSFPSKKNLLLCAHNGKEFDFPFIARRLLINGIKLPACLNLAGKKPWEVPHLDTLELWKFGDYKNFTSLNLLAFIFHIPTPKDDIDGSQVAKVYWEEKNLKRIVRYCEKDVVTVAQLLLRFNHENLIDEKNVFAVE